MEAIELKIPDENVCKQQYGCRITVDAGPPRVSMVELKSEYSRHLCIDTYTCVARHDANTYS